MKNIQYIIAILAIALFSLTYSCGHKHSDGHDHDHDHNHNHGTESTTHSDDDGHDHGAEGATHSSTPHRKLYYTNQLPKFPDRSYEEFAAQYTPPVDPNMLVKPEESLVSPALQRQPSSTATRDGITPSTPSTSPAPSAPSVLNTPSTPSGGGGGGY